jgi:hypothetical protein
VGPCPDTAGDCFIVSGTTSFSVVDPDGDPVSVPVVSAALVAGTTGTSGEAISGAGGTTFRFSGSVSSPRQFSPPNGTTPFSLVATATDPLGATGRLEVPVFALNRPPVLKLGLPSAVVSHRYDPARAAYVATAPLATFEDPDGDPLVQVGATGDDACARVAVSAGAASVSCELPYKVAAGLPALASFTGSHRVVARVTDGWVQVEAGTLVSIQDGAPTARPYSGTVESCSCFCAKWSADGLTCLGTPTYRVDTTSVPLPVLVDEADGDPVLVSFSGATPVGGAQKTVLPGSVSGFLASPQLPITVQFTIDDGLAQTQASSTVTGVICAQIGQACEL